MAENNAKHRQAMERLIVDNDFQLQSSSETRKRLGQILAFSIAIAFLAGSVWLGLTDHEVLAGALGGTTIVGLVTSFLGYQRRTPAGENGVQGDRDTNDKGYDKTPENSLERRPGE